MVVYKTCYFLPNNVNKTFVNRNKRYSDNSASVFVPFVIFRIWFSVNYCNFCIINYFGTVYFQSGSWDRARTTILQDVCNSLWSLWCFFFLCICRGLKEMEQDSSSMEKRIAYKFLKRLLNYVDSAQEFIAHLGEKKWWIWQIDGLIEKCIC